MSGSDSVTPVKLGCGTLILIAFIVLVFSRAGTEDMLEAFCGVATGSGSWKTRPTLRPPAPA